MPAVPRVACPISCLVTDRRRLADRLGLPHAAPEVLARLVTLVEHAGRAGVDLVQVRELDLESRELAALVVRILAAVNGAATRVVVNDRLDVALASGAAGVHLREASMPVSRVRALAPDGFLVGRSVHRPEDAASWDADYVVFGTVFASRSKAAHEAIAGIDGLQRAVTGSRVPVLAIGGVGRAELGAIAKAGAAGVAAIDLFLPSGRGDDLPLDEIVSAMHTAFDSAGSVS